MFQHKKRNKYPKKCCFGFKFPTFSVVKGQCIHPCLLITLLYAVQGSQWHSRQGSLLLHDFVQELKQH